MDLDPTSDVIVYCECGAKHRFAASHMSDSIECTMCGRRVRRTGRNAVHSAAAERTALQAIQDRLGDEDKVAQAVHLARDHRYQDALAMYLGVLNSHPHLRDIFYGMGYCHYRLGDFDYALQLLRLAREGGHATAVELMHKVEEHLAQAATAHPE